MSAEKNVSPAQELRAAASKIRETATRAMPGPWQLDGPYWHNDTYGNGQDPGMVSAGNARRAVAVASPLHPETEFNMPHIALWHPGVADAVADWLVSAAAIAEQGKDPSCVHRPVPYAALRLARAINGGA